MAVLPLTVKMPEDEFSILNSFSILRKHKYSSLQQLSRSVSLSNGLNPNRLTLNSISSSVTLATAKFERRTNKKAI